MRLSSPYAPSLEPVNRRYRPRNSASQGLADFGGPHNEPCGEGNALWMDKMGSYSSLAWHSRGMGSKFYEFTDFGRDAGWKSIKRLDGA